MQSLLGERASERVVFSGMWHDKIDIERMSERAAFTHKSWRRSTLFGLLLFGRSGGLERNGYVRFMVHTQIEHRWHNRETKSHSFGDG